MNKKSYVYKITCKITGEYYFGSSFRAKRDSYWGTGRKIKERILKYGKENFIKEILGEFDDRVEAHKVENEYIEKFRNDDKCLNQMLNRHFGSFSEETREKMSDSRRGEKNHNFGKTFSEETREKMSAAQRGEKNHNFGKTFSEEHRAKMSAALRGEKNPMYGKHFSEETRAKLSASKRGEKNPWYGKHHTEEVKAKISAALCGENHPMYGKHFSEEHKAKISAALRGKHWRKNPITGKREWYE